MDKIGFDDTDQAYQAALKLLRAKIKAQVEAEQSGNQSFKFNAHDAQWKLDKYPYTAQEKEKAKANHEQSVAVRQALIMTEVETRMAQQSPILEKHIFGDQGRQHALEQMQREEKIQAFKAQQRNREEQDQQKDKAIEQTKLQSKQVAQDQKNRLAVEQDNYKSVNMKADFKDQNEKAQQKMEIDAKIRDFKDRQRQKEASAREQAARDLKPEPITNDFNSSNTSEAQEAFKERQRKVMDQESTDRENKKEGFVR